MHKKHIHNICDIISRGPGTGGGAVVAACSHNSEAVGEVPPHLFIWLGNVGAVVVPKLWVVVKKNN